MLVMSHNTRSPTTVTVFVRNAQHAFSRSARVRAHSAIPGSAVSVHRAPSGPQTVSTSFPVV
jgi:glutamyl-tRNA reductase